MKLGVMMALFASKTLDEALDYAASQGLGAIEMCCGGYPGSPHWNVPELLSSSRKRKEMEAKFRDRNLQMSAFAVHGNPLHPDKKLAKADHEAHRNAAKLAQKMGVDVVINFSGCPGDSDRAKYPNWVTCPWPDDFSAIVKWQWEKKVIPYWKAEAKFAAQRGIKIAFEMHPGFVVYNTETLLKLREAGGENLGANFDPSHLFWQGMDPIVSLRQLKGAVFHVHAKDCRIDPVMTSRNGVLDTKHYGDVFNRSWVFRTVGFGHGEDFWRDFLSMLRVIGYDGAISIEHEDGLMSMTEGFEKAVAFLQNLLLREKTGEMWWA
jgi:sugar phosphate isomerase/epimerase